VDTLRPRVPLLSVLGSMSGGSQGSLWAPWGAFWRFWNELCAPGLQKEKLEWSKRRYEANTEVVIFVCVLLRFLRLVTPTDPFGGVL